MPRIRAGAREERTFALAGVEVRSGDGEPPVIVGHAAVYNRWSEDLGGFKERVLPGAFTKTLVGGDVRALFNHDPNFLLGRTKSGTLTLADEAKGLHFEANPPDTQTIRDLVLEPMRRGDVDQCSFSFSVPGGWRRLARATRRRRPVRAGPHRGPPVRRQPGHLPGVRDHGRRGPLTPGRHRRRPRCPDGVPRPRGARPAHE